MKPFIVKYQFHLLLLFIGLVWIFLFDYLTQSCLQSFISPDAKSYKEASEKLYLLHSGDQYRPLLMALITGIPYIFGSSDDGIFIFSNIVNLLCWLGTLLVILELLNQFLKPPIAFAYALLCVFLVGINALIFELATENIYLFFIVSAFYFLTRYYKDKSFKFICIALALLVLSMLIKPGSKFLAIIATLYFLREILINFRSKFAWLIYGSYFAVLIQCCGIKYQFGNFTVSYIDAVTYYDYLGAKAESLRLEKPFKTIWKERANFIYSQPFPQQKEIAAHDFFDQLQSNTSNFFKAYFLNLTENATSGSTNIRRLEKLKQSNYFKNIKTLVFNVSMLQNIIISTAGFLLALFFLWKRNHIEKAFLFPAFFVLYTMLLSAVSCSEGDRFHVVAFPLVIVLLAKFAATKRTDFGKD